jgi:hypothetical protein
LAFGAGQQYQGTATGHNLAAAASLALWQAGEIAAPPSWRVQRCGQVAALIQGCRWWLMWVYARRCHPTALFGHLAAALAARSPPRYVGDKWSIVVIVRLREGGTMRFGQLGRAVGGISQRMLTLTLRPLERDGLILRTTYAEVPPSSSTPSSGWAEH